MEAISPVKQVARPFQAADRGRPPEWRRFDPYSGASRRGSSALIGGRAAIRPPTTNVATAAPLADEGEFILPLAVAHPA
jgi:hypothetical protein